MKNPFAKQRQITDAPNRNTFDLSHSNNFTAKMGYLYPILCQEVLPGESFKIKASAQLNAMPLKFPVQTPINAHFHYFYCRNRNVWDDWQDYITKVRDGLVHPYLELNGSSASQMLKNGELADFLGVPTDIYGDYSKASSTHVFKYMNGITPPLTKWGVLFSVDSTAGYLPLLSQFSDYIGLSIDTMINQVGYTAGYHLDPISGEPISWTYSMIDSIHGGYYVDLLGPDYTYTKSNGSFWFIDDSFTSFQQQFSFKVGAATSISSANSNTNRVGIAIFNNDLTLLGVYDTNASASSSDVIQCDIGATALGEVQQMISQYTNIRVAFFRFSSSGAIAVNTADSSLFRSYNTNQSYGPSLNTVSYPVSVTVSGTSSSPYISAVDPDVLASNPFVGSNAPIHLNALVFRHYEQIYNSFYRDTLNNPYYVNGQQQFNDFIPTHAGGADENIYLLHRRNWELDFLTSAVPSPQFGVAPLVGVTVNPTAASAQLTFDISGGNIVEKAVGSSSGSISNVTYDLEVYDSVSMSNPSSYDASSELTGTAEVKLGNDGETIVGITKYDRTLPPATLQDLFQSINYGISINDIRNVNSFQRFKERMIARGSLKYRDQLMAHFGVEPDYTTIDLPSFEGGFTIPIGVRTVTQQANIDVGNPQFLGDIAGQINMKGFQDNEVQIYTPEHGYIFCIMSITPIPVYSQLLPKYLTKITNSFDYFTPEFSKIGYQPIPYREVCPLQGAVAGLDLNTTFGYQRPYYDYIQQYDTVHGLLRTNLRDFLINRVFDSRPELGEDFLLVDPKQVNDVFAVTEENNDTFVCQAFFDIKAKRIIPRLSVPSLE